MVTHDLAQAARTGDRTAFFFEGRLVEEGPTKQLFLSPQHEETVRYFAPFRPAQGSDQGSSQTAGVAESVSESQ